MSPSENDAPQPASSAEPASAGQNRGGKGRALVLVGAGHAHLQIVRWWRRQPLDDVRLTLVSAFDRATYSGMLPGTIAGRYRPDQMQIELEPLARCCGAQLIADRANGLDAERRLIQLAHHPPVSYDVASINIGSVPSGAECYRMHGRVLSIKPMATFLSRLETRIRELREQFGRRRPDEMLPVAIVGGGAAGVEMALCLEQRLHDDGVRADMHLLEAGPEVMPGYLPQTERRARRLLTQRGIRIHTGARVTGFEDDAAPRLVLEQAEPIRAGLVLWATGAAPPAVLEQFDLPKSPRGFLAVRATLQSTAGDPVFVVGDTADLIERPVPKAGVYAVMQAPVLWENIRSIFEGGELVEYKPQPDFLSLLSSGDGRALLQYKNWSAYGRWVWWLKDWIDRSFVRKFRC